MSASDIYIPSDPLLDCPTCGMPAEMTDRFVLDGVPTRVEHVKLVCVRGHWYTPPADQLLILGSRRPQARHSAAVLAAGSRRDRHVAQEIDSPPPRDNAC
jgi:hypothetical protein